ncbi:helix-turn-helix domain-containing protein [Nocardia sp. NPDC059240]|uniref:helix-turn-helix domain-containing protein n=1 Tax=Nocardia sp. NPDC059240 TaxID=3346786 RepID=UPI00367EE399
MLAPEIRTFWELAGARECLFGKGYARTTVRDIATASGVSMAAVGHHFGSKEALLTAALGEATREWGWRGCSTAPTRTTRRRAGRSEPSTRRC